MRLFLSLCFCCVAMTLAAQQTQSEMIPNPQLKVTYDTEKFEKVSKELGLPRNVLMLKANEIAQYKEKFKQLSKFDYFTVGFWKSWQNPDKQFFAFQKNNDGYWILDISSTSREGLYILLNQPLQAHKTYEIRIRYRYLAEQNLANLPVLNVWFGKDEALKMNQLTKVGNLFASRSSRKEEARRRNIIKEFQQNYGGFYADDFAQMEKLPEWQEINWKIKAKGNERILLIGYEWTKHQSKYIQSNLICDIDEVSVRPYQRETTFELNKD